MTAYQLFQLPFQANIDSSVRIVPGAKANFYITGTTTRQDTYADSALTTPNANPVVADGNGVLAPIYLDPTKVYKLTLTTSADVLIRTVDPINDQILSQIVIGQFLYPRTTTEVSASVIPTFYFYPPGDIRRYGAVGDDSTDDALAFQAAFDSNNTIVIPMPPVRYFISKQINGTPNKPMSIIGGGYGWNPGGVPSGGAAIRLSSTATAGSAIFDWADRVQGVSISGLQFVMTSTGGKSFRAIRFQEVLQASITRNRCEGLGGSSEESAFIELLDPTIAGGVFTGAVDIQRNYIAGGNRYGVILRANCTTVRICNNEFYGNNPAFSSLIGVFCESGVVGATINENAFQGWDRGILDQGTANNYISNYFEANGTADIDASSATKAVIIGNRRISGGAVTAVFNNSAGTILINEQNFHIDNAIGEFGLGLRERQRSINVGEWTTYAPAYTGSGTLTYTGVTSTTIRYRLVGNSMQVQWLLSGTVGGAGAEIRIALPSGTTASGRCRNVIFNFENAAQKFGVAECQNGNSFIRIYKDNAVSGNWTAGTADTYGDLEFLVSGI